MGEPFLQALRRVKWSARFTGLSAARRSSGLEERGVRFQAGACPTRSRMSRLLVPRTDGFERSEMVVTRQDHHQGLLDEKTVR
jgi:hypothetical protein